MDAIHLLRARPDRDLIIAGKKAVTLKPGTAFHHANSFAMVRGGHFDLAIRIMSVDIGHHTIEANGIKQHVVVAGSGAPVVLLHGFPETWYAWRHQIPVLGRKYKPIVPDLRGYGATEKPAAGYDKRTMAKDIKDLMNALGIERAPIVGHDRGARVGTRFAKDYPQATDRFAALDNVPTRIIYDRMDATVARGHWFFLFNAVRDLPEQLITGREEEWLRFIFSFIFVREIEAKDSLLGEIKRRFGGPVIANELMSRADGERLIEASMADALAFGRDYIATPDLAERLLQSLPLNTPDKNTFYGEGPVGYTDYPRLTPKRQEAETSSTAQ